VDLKLKDKIAVVGGASQGIGFGIARQLAAEGTRVAITARREKDLIAAAQKIAAETGAQVLPVQADCRQAADCARVVETVAAAFARIDILVNNDGAPPLGDIAGFDDVAWQKAMEQNFMYVTRMCRGVLPYMERAGGGSILNITAISAIQPIPRFGLSVASWGAVIGYAKTLALEVASFGINVNTVCPGYVDTPRLEKVFSTGEKPAHQMREELEREVPLGRIGTVADIASLVALLVSPRGSYITGTVIPIDGGLFRAVR
jgi:3-oxoacyl-[acyl-carrier protein] reductase